MTLFSYEHCKRCKKRNNENKLELSKVLPVNVWNIIVGYNVSCLKCKSLHSKDVKFMKDKELPDEGLEKAELQLDFSKDPMEFHTYGHPNTMYFHYDKKHRKRIDRLFDEDIVKEPFNGKRMFYQALKILSICICFKDHKCCRVEFQSKIRKL